MSTACTHKRRTSTALLLAHCVGCWAAQHWLPCLLQLHHNLQKAAAHLRDMQKHCEPSAASLSIHVRLLPRRTVQNRHKFMPAKILVRQTGCKLSEACIPWACAHHPLCAGLAHSAVQGPWLAHCGHLVQCSKPALLCHPRPAGRATGCQENPEGLANTRGWTCTHHVQGGLQHPELKWSVLSGTLRQQHHSGGVAGAPGQGLTAYACSSACPHAPGQHDAKHETRWCPKHQEVTRGAVLVAVVSIVGRHCCSWLGDWQVMSQATRSEPMVL